MRIQKSSRPLVILLATLVAILTSMVVANATQTITTPNAVNIPYNLAAGANSAAITPVANKPVLVMGCCTSSGGGSGPAVSQVNLLRISGGLITWTGYESFPSTAFTQGSTNTAGSHIVYINYNHQVDVQTASADTILIHNGTSATQAGNVTLIW